MLEVRKNFQACSLTQVCLYKLWYFCCATKKCLEVSDAELSIGLFFTEKVDLNPSQVKFKASARFILNVFYIFLLSLVQCDTENNKKGAAIFKIDNYKEKKSFEAKKKSLFSAARFFLPSSYSLQNRFRCLA